MREFVDPLGDWPCPPPPGYRGQLDGGFQRDRAALYEGVGEGDCAWYHSTELPTGLRHGQWDLRGREAAYLGGVDLAGRRVLELGPASGHLTFFMEAQGADVTAFEVGYDARIAMVPAASGTDVDALEAGLMQHTRRTVNAWWYLHRLNGSCAKMVHGDIRRLPDDIGTYDVVVLGSILLHCRDFPMVLMEAAAHAADAVVVTEPYHRELDSGTRLMCFLPQPDQRQPSVTWWRFSPAAVASMLWRLGFTRPSLHHHSQAYRDEAGAWSEVPYFTVVAARASAPATEVPGWLSEPAAAAPDGAAGLLADNQRLNAQLQAVLSSRTVR